MAKRRHRAKPAINEGRYRSADSLPTFIEGTSREKKYQWKTQDGACYRLALIRGRIDRDKPWSADLTPFARSGTLRFWPANPDSRYEAADAEPRFKFRMGPVEKF